jgi:MOSC domain-containing protein YiiM
MPAATVLAVSIVAKLRPDSSNPGELTAIDKRALSGRVAVRTLGVDGDRQCDTRNHGGPDKAVYAYAVEDARWWERELGRPLPPGSFGENLTTEGLDVTGAVIGERWAIGTTELQVVWPRIPCRTFAAFWDVGDLVKRFTQHGAPGAYLRVTREGDIGAGDAVDVVHRPAHGVTLGEVFRARSGERALVPRMLEADDLPEDAKDWARRVLGVANR